MPSRFSAKDAQRLVEFCQDVDQARYLIENSAVLGPIYDILQEPDARQYTDQQLLDRYKKQTGEKVFLDDFRHYLDWFRNVGLWTW